MIVNYSKIQRSMCIWNLKLCPTVRYYTIVGCLQLCSKSLRWVFYFLLVLYILMFCIIIILSVLSSQIGQTCNFHRLSNTTFKPVSLAPSKFLAPDLRNLTAASFTFIRHSSDDSHKQSSLADNKDESEDLTDNIIPEAPQVPIETNVEQVEIVLVY